MAECDQLCPRASEPLNKVVYNGVIGVIVIFVFVVFNVNVTYNIRGFQEDNVELVMHVVDD